MAFSVLLSSQTAINAWGMGARGIRKVGGLPGHRLDAADRPAVARQVHAQRDRNLPSERSELRLPGGGTPQNRHRRAGAVEDDGADPQEAYDLAVLVTERGVSSARPRRAGSLNAR